MAVKEIKSVLNRYFENTVDGLTYNYDASQEKGKAFTRINFSVEKERVTIARGHQVPASGNYYFEVVSSAFPVDSLSVQQQIINDFNALTTLIEEENG